MKRIKSRIAPAVAGAALVGAAFIAAPASAQEPGLFPAERFRPTLDREGFADVESATVPGHLQFDLGLWAGYAASPVTVSAIDDGSVQRIASLVNNRLGGSIVGQLGLFDLLEIGLEIPATFYQDANIPNPNDPALAGLVAADPLASFGFGDLRLSSKLGIMKTGKHGLDLAVMATFTMPTNAPQKNYFGEQDFTFTPELLIGRTSGALRVGANLGYRVRPTTQLGDLVVGSEFTYRAGLAYNFQPRFELPVELGGSISGSFADTSRLNQSPLEVLGTVVYNVADPLQMILGGGVGLVGGYGTPDWRGFAALRFSPRPPPPPPPPPDTDKDGIADPDDRCPEVAGISALGGCPDGDNDNIADIDDKCPDVAGLAQFGGCADQDNDGIADPDDKCPAVAGVPEQKGCPEPDTDKDGILDKNDVCPTVAGVEAFQGCPDQDGDGVEDSKDKCQTIPGLASMNGCPDKDGDKIIDQDDQCPDVAGVKAFFGCPDTDKDGIPDHKDKCPTEAEVINGVDDEDGCPDKGKSSVKLTGEKIEILDKVFFELDKATIDPRSFKLLDQVAATLRANQQLTKIRIEGHTDDQGDDDYNMKLSQERADAVRTYLIDKGIDAERVLAVGYGETKPLMTGTSKKARDTNRRVEFNIIEVDGQPTTSQEIKTEIKTETKTETAPK